MKRIINFLLILLAVISCNRGPRIAKYYDEKTGEYIIDTLPYNDLRDYPKLQKTKNIDSLIHEIKKEDYVFEKSVGIAGSYPEQYARFERLIQLSSSKELFNLTKNESPIVRVYAYKGLKIMKSKYSKMAEEVLKKDTTKFSRGAGCLINRYSVAEYINSFR